MIYIVEGNIGAGKSTFLKLINEQMPQVSVSLEPLYDWQHQIYGQSLLTNFYQEPKRWAYTMETLTLMSRIKEHLAEQELKTPVRIMERSIYSGHHCFAKNGHEHGFLQNVEWQMYHEWYTFLSQKCQQPAGFIYLKVSPDIAYERIKKRNRLSEKKLTLHYLKQIDQKHEEFLIKKQDIGAALAQVPVLTLSCDQEFASDETTLQKHIEALQEFIKETTYTKQVGSVPQLNKR